MNTIAGTAQRYRRWQRKPARFRSSYLAIVRTGLKLGQQDAQLRFLLWFALAFAISIGSLFYTFSALEILAGTEQADRIADFVEGFAYNMLRIELPDITDIGKYREVLWRAVFLLALKVEMFWVMITVSRIGPGLISDDIRTRALPIYFARPVTPISYLAGKWSIVAFYIALVTLVPNLVALSMSVLLTGGLHTVGQTLNLFVDVIVVGLGIMVFAGTLVLALSATVADRRFVTVGWFMACIVPLLAQEIVRDAMRPKHPTGWLGSLSPADNLQVLSEWLFDMRRVFAEADIPADAFRRALLSNTEPTYPAIVMAALTVAGLWWCHHRIVRFSRAAANIQ